MKKIIFVLALLLSLVLLLVACKSVDPGTLVELENDQQEEDAFIIPQDTDTSFHNGFYFTSNGDGTCFISATALQSEAELVVPSTSPEGDSVKAIGANVFWGCNNLASITLPEGLTRIESFAFYGCSALSKINLPDGLTGIGYFAFQDCTSLTEIALPEGITKIGEGAFSGCSSLTSISIPKSITNLDESVFSGCSIEAATISANAISLIPKDNLKTVVLTDGESITEWAFKDCTSLTSITISDSVISIGEFAFSGCTSLTSITVPDSITSIKGHAFSDCTALTNVTISNRVTSIENCTFYGCTSLASITIPRSVTSIGYSAFSGCTSLTSATIPNSVTSIGGYAFSDCTSLMNITIPESVMSIGSSAFHSCYRLVEVRNLSAIQITAGWNFGDAGYYAKHVYKDGESYLHSTDDGFIFYDDGRDVYLIRYNGAETELTLAETYNGRPYSLYEYAFENCTALTGVTIGNGVESIGFSAFSGCSSLTNITIPDSLKIIGQSSFEACTALASVTIGNGVTSIGSSAFRNCTSLTSVTIGDSVTGIGEGAFSGCPIETATIPAIACSYIKNRNLKTVIITSGTSIGYEAFESCNALTSVTIGNSVTRIGSEAFCACTSLKSITIPDSVNDIGSDAFNGCLIESATIPAIACSYIKNNNLKTVVITSGWSIGNSAFLSCTSLTSVTILSNMTSIESEAFSGCSSLANITIPDSVTSIGSSAFKNCFSLASITIPSNVTTIGGSAFYGCYNLLEVQNLSALNFSAGSTYNGRVAYYAKHIYKDGESYLHATGNGFVFYDDGTDVYLIKYIGTETELTLPQTYNGKSYVIYQYSFYNFSTLTSVIIPDSVTSIGSYAFYNCSKLTSVTVSSSVARIGEGAFSNCFHLIEIHNLSALSISTKGYNYGYIGLHAKRVYKDGESYLHTTDDGFVFYDDGTNVYLIQYNGAEAELILPESYNGKSYAINQYAFYGQSLTSITMPNNVTSIGISAFQGCASLTRITYQGTMKEWKAISKGSYWNNNTGSYTVYCTDGDIAK